MTRSLMLIVLGVLIALAPFSGVPFTHLTWFFFVSGLIVVLTGGSYKYTSSKAHHARTDS